MQTGEEYSSGTGEELKMFVEIVSIKSGEVVKRMGPFSERTADRVENGALINLNHEDYFTRQVAEELKGGW